jgi:hypothetical protein
MVAAAQALFADADVDRVTLVQKGSKFQQELVFKNSAAVDIDTITSAINTAILEQSLNVPPVTINGASVSVQIEEPVVGVAASSITIDNSGAGDLLLPGDNPVATNNPEPSTTGMSGGAVAGILIPILLVIGALIWWFGFARRSGGGARGVAGDNTELEMAETRRNTMGMEENPLAAARRAQAAGNNTAVNSPVTPTLDQQHNYAGIPEAVNRFPNPMYQTGATVGGGSSNASDATYYESEPVPTDQDYIEMGNGGGTMRPARAAEGDYSSYTVAGGLGTGNPDYAEPDAGDSAAVSSNTVPLNPDQAYADPSGYAEASVYVSPDAATYGAPVVNGAAPNGQSAAGPPARPTSSQSGEMHCQRPSPNGGTCTYAVKLGSLFCTRHRCPQARCSASKSAKAKGCAAHGGEAATTHPSTSAGTGRPRPQTVWDEASASTATTTKGGRQRGGVHNGSFC